VVSGSSVGKPKPRRRGKPKLEDVARLAQVGIATVDRVLNERANVSPETARKVIDAARQLKLPRSLPVPYRRGLRLDVILARPDTPFFDRLNRAFVAVAATLDRSVIVQRSFVDETKPQQVAARILATKGHAVVVYGQEHALIVEAATTVTSAGIPVVAVTSDLPTTPRLAYVGIDHYGAGRTAGYFMARMVREPGPILALFPSFGYRAHVDRISGFRDGLAERAPGFVPVDLLQGRDEQAFSEEVVRSALLRLPETKGIYNAGAANRAVERALIAHGLTGKVVFIGHELTVHTARMLATGVMTLTMDQNPEEQARRAIDVLLRRFGYAEGPPVSQEVPFTIFCPENLQPPREAGSSPRS
jgi:LacI family transcriptional regulator